MVSLAKIEISGYKSIRRMSLDLRQVNVLIGPNGAGKSNLVSFFRLLGEMVEGRLQRFVGVSGGANSLLFDGPKTTASLHASLTIAREPADVSYEMVLDHTETDTLVLATENARVRPSPPPDTWSNSPVQVLTSSVRTHGVGTQESMLRHDQEGKNEAVSTVRKLLGSCRVFQFHDTSRTSRMLQSCYIHDNKALWHDAGNLAAVLYKLKQKRPPVYGRIVRTIRQFAPWFDDFDLEPLALNEENVLLNYRERDSDILFKPHQISDGTLRAMALTTLLLQPRDDLPSVMVIDEPELGLHPYAMVVLAALVKQAACHCQIILATQSTALLDQFEAEDVVVVEREDRGSTFVRLQPEALEEWLQEYTLSELWEKNVLGGGPA
ncbi:MAG: AAA family ATPase [Planctomycetes bacterium]|nr:AAA family ATPase [Planctomycetota bacterium]